MFCTKCGSQNDDNSNFCGVCGTPLVKSGQNNSEYSASDINNQYGQNTNTYSATQSGSFNQYNNSSVPRVNTMALAGFITSCGSIFFWGIAGIVGLILSLIGFHQTGVKNEKGRGFAVAGIIIGCLSIATMILFIIYLFSLSPYELRRMFFDYNDYGYYGYGTTAAKALLSVFF